MKTNIVKINDFYRFTVSIEGYNELLTSVPFADEQSCINALGKFMAAKIMDEAA